jgi:isoleucyl-tRNA synthetase
MYLIGEALVRWIAPILSFTAEEIWENLPGERAPSVMLVEWYQGLQNLPAGEVMGRDYWGRVMVVRAAVNKAMEAKRAAGDLRGSLDATVTLYCSSDLHEALMALGDELRFVLITSAAALIPLDAAPEDSTVTELPDLRLSIAAATEEKCARCWHHCVDVGHSSRHPTLCGRCIQNIEGTGEQRRFA